MQSGLKVVIIGCVSLSAVIPADGILFSFLLLTCTLVFQLASLPGRGQAMNPLPAAIPNRYLITSKSFPFPIYITGFRPKSPTFPVTAMRLPFKKETGS